MYFREGGRLTIISTRSSSLVYCCIKSTVTFIAVSSALISVPSFAKEREPEPIEDPGECPIDAPIRVASLDSLRHFEGLIGHCPESTLIESPAARANRPRGVVRDVSIPSEPTPEARQELGARLIIAKAGSGEGHVGAKEPSRKEHEAVTVTSSDGSSVSITPPKSAFTARSVSGTVMHADTDDVEAVLALRPQSYSTSFDETISVAARRHSVDPLLLHAVITQESRYKHRAVSHAGARGLMQVMPATGRRLGVQNSRELFDPETNINAGAKLLSQLWQRYDGNIDLVLAAYNAGEGAVQKYGMTVPPIRETRNYVAKVKAIYTRLAGESGIAVNF